MASLQLDHIAICATHLESGVDYVQSELNVALRPGGKHPHFGTHNRLLGLSDDIYLEVISVDPDAPQPNRPRWFDLDRFQGPPRFANWICRTNNIAEIATAHPDAGKPVALSRGELSWQMAVPDSGVLPYDNCFPAVIEWDGKAHPANLLPKSGCRLHRLIVSHPSAYKLQKRLTPMLTDERIGFSSGPPGLIAEIKTPSGLRVLR